MHGLPPDDLVPGHLWLVDKLAAQYHAQAPHADLYAAGALGLVEAASRFDPSRGVKFGTFAWHFVRGAILREVRSSHVVVIPDHALREARRAGTARPSAATTDATRLRVLPGQDEAADRAMRRRALPRALGAVRGTRRRVVLLTLRGESPDEIAARLGVTPERARNLLCEAEQAMAKAVGA